MMCYQQYGPSALLSDVVECYWVFCAPFPSESRRETLVPGGRIEWMFNFGAPLQWMIGVQDNDAKTYHGSLIMGQRDRAYFAKLTGETNLMGIRFKPGGFSAFCNNSAHTFLNRLFPADDVLTFSTDDLNERLIRCHTDGDKIAMLEQFLLQHKEEPSTQQKEALEIIDALRNCSDIHSIEEYCSRSNTHYKKLERVFLKYVGYTPKRYLRILRFNKALRQLDGPAHLTRLAYDAGYFDQSHFIKDFRRFAGMTPGFFDPSHHPVPRILIDHQPV